MHAYAAALGETNPEYRVGADDAEGMLAPPAFAAVYALAAGSVGLAQLGIPPQRLIHGEQEFTWRRAVRVGEQLTTQARIADIYQKRNLQFVVAEAAVTDAAGEEVCRSRATIVVLPDPGAGGNGVADGGG